MSEQSFWSVDTLAEATTVCAKTVGLYLVIAGRIQIGALLMLLAWYGLWAIHREVIR